MKRLIQFAVFMTALILVAGCGRKVNCPDFNQDVLQWIPYENNDTIRLQNLANDSLLMLPVRHIFVSHTTHYMTNLKCGECYDHISVNAESSNNDFYADFYLDKNQISAQNFLIKGSGFDDNSNHYSEQSYYTFEGNEYDNVRIFTNDNATALFSKLIIAKGYGIIGLIDREGNTWKLQNPVLKNTGKIEVEVINTSCD